MSYSVASSPTLLDHPHTFDDVDTSNYRDFRLVDGDVRRIDFSTPSGSLEPPPYPEQYSYLTSSDGDDTPRTSRYSAISSTQDGQYTPRVASPSDDSMQKRFSPTMSQQQRPPAGLQLLYTHIAHGAIHDSIVERFNAPACHAETHRAIVDDVMSWIQYTPPTSGSANPAALAAEATPPTPTYTSATLSFYGPHARRNAARNRSASMAPPPSQPEYLLWVIGPTSSGKSSLMQTIAERCSNTYTTSQFSANGGLANALDDRYHQSDLPEPPVPLLAGTFFFRYHRSPRNNKSKFVTTLAYQLARSIPGLGDLIAKVIERDVGILTLGEDDPRASSSGKPGGSGLATQMEKLILQPLAILAQRQAGGSRPRKHLSSTHRVILIDAVDECINDEDQIEVLSLIRKLSQDLRRFVPYFRLVVSSKPHRTIERQFKLHPDLDAVTYRLVLPFAEKSAGRKVVEVGAGTGRGRARAAMVRRKGTVAKSANLDEEVVVSGDTETDIRLYLQCKFNEICRQWYGLPRNVGWPVSIDMSSDDKDNAISRLVYNASGKFSYALTVIRFITRGDWGVFDNLAESSDPRRLLELVLQAKFTKSYQEPYAALDALYGVIIQDAAEKSGLTDVSKLAKVVRQIDELLSSGGGIGVELTLPRLALFYGFDWDSAGEGKCFEAALVGGLLSAVLDVPVPPQDELDAFPAVPGLLNRFHGNGGTVLRRVVKFHDRTFGDFIKDPKRAKGLYVSRSQLYTDLAVRYLKSASVQYSAQPTVDRSHPSSEWHFSKSGKTVLSPASSSSSFSATCDADHPEGGPFSAPATLTTFRRGHHRQATPYSIDPDDAAHFFSELHLGKFCSFAVVDSPALVKELMQFDVELWLFGIAASLEEPLDIDEPSSATTMVPPHMLTMRSAGPGKMPTFRPSHRRVMSEVPSNATRYSAFPALDSPILPDPKPDKDRKRTEALLKLHGNPAVTAASPTPTSAGGGLGGGGSGPESDIEAMYRWVHVECAWSSCTPVCKRWRRAIVKFWQRQGAPQQPTVMDRIYDKFMPRDVKRVKLITSRYRL